MINGDRDRLRQVIVNIVGNAIKFTQQGEIVLQVIPGNETDQTIDLKFKIIDTGIGIAREKLDGIFQEFTQADPSMTREYGGTGLGLAISRKLAGLMGGDISVTSEEDVGSTFVCTMVFSKTNGVSSRQLPDLQNLATLIVDDNEKSAQVLTDILNNWHCETEVLLDGYEAMNKLNARNEDNNPYSLVLIDADMPVVDGFDIARHIHESSGTTPHVVMLLNNIDLQNAIEHCKKIGVQHYLVKPLNESDVFDTLMGIPEIEAIIDQAIKEYQNQSGGKEENSHGIAIQSRSMRVLLAEDNVINQKLATTVLEKMGHTVTVAKDGIETLDALDHATFDVILMDVQMPRKDGLETTRAIRGIESQTGMHIPIIALTAHAMKGDRERFLDAGMDDYLSKPIAIDQLHAALEAISVSNT
jgi:CheY-like chemotaxis protein